MITFTLTFKNTALLTAPPQVVRLVMATQRGLSGYDGLSAYEIAVQNGFVGTEQDWLATISSSTTFTHSFTDATSTFVIHNLGYKPLVQIFDNGGQSVTASITHANNSRFDISFTPPLTGYLTYK